ncbi:MAG: hypothetical protein ACE5IJ_08800 [Thermoplasmata archaeon]
MKEDGGSLKENLEKLGLIKDFPHQFDPQDPASLAEIAIPLEGDIRIYSLANIRNWRMWQRLARLIAQEEEDPKILTEKLLRSTVSVGAKGLDIVIRTGYAGLVPKQRVTLGERWRRWRGKE